MDRWHFGEIDEVLLLGGGPLLTRAAEQLVRRDVEVKVVTAPRQADQPSHVEGQTLTEFARSRELSFEVVDDPGGSKLLQSVSANGSIGFSFGAPWILDAETIERFDGNLVNGHGRRLPQGRGGGGFSWHILRDSSLGYSAYHLITPEIDDGPLLAIEEYRFPSACRTPEEYQAYANDRMFDLFKDVYRRIQAGESFRLQSQPDHLSIYWPRLHTETQAFLDWSWDLDEIERFIRAFDDPYAGASTFHDGQRIHLKKASAETVDGGFHPFQTGIVYRKHRGKLYVAANQGTLVVEEVLADGDDYIDQVGTGDRFYTPVSKLQRAQRVRPKYDAKGPTIKDPEPD